MVVGDSFFSPGGPSRVVAAGSRPDHPEARGRSKSQERGGPGPHAKPDGQILVFWIIIAFCGIGRGIHLHFAGLVVAKCFCGARATCVIKLGSSCCPAQIGVRVALRCVIVCVDTE